MKPPHSASASGGVDAVIPLATYRLQLHAGFGFTEAEQVLPYLRRLGISHVYCSPIGTARAGSLHGYDVVDPSRISEELGGRDGFLRFSAAARSHGLGLLLDLVPNHMGVFGRHNPWWSDVLENGKASEFADYFDIEWQPATPGLAGRLLAPILGDPYGQVLERGEIVLAFDAERGGFVLDYHAHRFPLDPKTYPMVLGSAPHDILQTLARAFEALPSRDDPEPTSRVERLGEQRMLQRRLAETIASNRTAARALSDVVERINRPDSRDALDALHDAQAFRLASWRSAADQINYRRFFDVNELAALRTEDERVFEATQGPALDLAAAGLVDGLRIDHPDGLADPQAYFDRLQQGFARRRGLPAPDLASGEKPLYVLAEKIAAGHEHVPERWALHGTTGYRFAMLVNGLFVDRRQERAMERLWRSHAAVSTGYADMAYECKRLVAREALGADLTELANALHRIAQSDRSTRDLGFTTLRDALAEVAAGMPVYRTYVSPGGDVATQDLHFIDWAIAQARRHADTPDPTLHAFIRRALLGEPLARATTEIAAATRRFAQRFQQFTAPVAAKGIEDTAFYRYHRLISLNEVGGDPAVFGISAAAFHGASAQRARHWPHTMLATSTHDNKRSEDVRNRINVLSEKPAWWRLALSRWRVATRAWRVELDGREAPSPSDQYLLHQTLLGTLPAEGFADETALDDYRRRIEAYMLKAARESKQQTRWVWHNDAYEAALTSFVRGVLGRVTGNPVLSDLRTQAERLAWYGSLNSLSLTVLKFTSPGVPDVYQGTELIDLSLVDPDNRRPVDYRARAGLLDAFDAWADRPDERSANLNDLASTPTDGRLKLWLIRRLLALRRSNPTLFERGSYAPLKVTGSARRHAIAFARRGDGKSVIVLVARRFVGLGTAVGQWPVGSVLWGDTQVRWPSELHPDGVEMLTGLSLCAEGGALSLAAAFAHLPFCVIEVTHPPHPIRSDGLS